jgi:hypothetical protein
MPKEIKIKEGEKLNDRVLCLCVSDNVAPLFAATMRTIHM